MGWTSAKDNPPMVTAGYIIAVDDGRGNKWPIPGTYSLEMKTWFGEFGEIKNRVTHWMSLPKPPGQMTNGDRIRAMTDEELYDFFRDIYNAGANDAEAWEWGNPKSSFEWDEDWFQQPAKEG